MAGVITTLIVSLCIGMVVYGVEGYHRKAAECAVLFFALLAAFFSPNPQFIIYPFLLHTAFSLLAERLIARQKIRAAANAALFVLPLLALAAWCLLRGNETQSNWPLLALFPAYVFFRVLMLRKRHILAMLLYFAGILTLIPWSRQIREDEIATLIWHNWKDHLEQNPFQTLPDVRYNTPPHLFKPPTPTTNPKE